jgi:hypothetical protein
MKKKPATFWSKRLEMANRREFGVGWLWFWIDVDVNVNYSVGL